MPGVWDVAPFLFAGALLIAVVVGVIGTVRGMLTGDGHYGIIELYSGFVRHGKTMLATQDCIALARARNAILASNITVTAEGVETALLAMTDDGLDLDQLMVLALRCREEGRGLVLFIDEAGIVMPARQWQSFPVGLMFLLQQSGKLMVEIRVTAQHPMFVDSIMRSLTAVVHNVRCVPPPTIYRRQRLEEWKGRTGLRARLMRRYYRPWWFIVTTTIPGDFGTSEPDKVMWRRRVKYRAEWEGAYDTDLTVYPAGRLKGASEFMARLAAAKRAAQASESLTLDPRVTAMVESLPHGQREAVAEAIRNAGPAT